METTDKASLSGKKSEEADKFKSTVSKTYTLAGFLSVTKKLQAQFDRIVDAIHQEGQRKAIIDQAHVKAINELTKAVTDLSRSIHPSQTSPSAS